VLVAVCRRFVVVVADAVSCAGRRVGVCNTWGGVGVAELGGAALTPWGTLFVGRGFLEYIWAPRCGCLCCVIAGSFGGAGCMDVGIVVAVEKLGASGSGGVVGGTAKVGWDVSWAG
jgi:hypothetical protein